MQVEVMVDHIEPRCCFHSKSSVIDTNVHLKNIYIFLLCKVDCVDH